MNFDDIKGRDIKRGEIKHKNISNTGFDNTGKDTGRIMDKFGRANVRKTGLSSFQQMSPYHTLLEMSLGKFILLCFTGFLLINLLFGSIYFLLDPIHLGISQELSSLHQFLECMFFSAQTITTVGFGKSSPHNIPTGIVSSLEAFFGLLSFAVLTGLIYGRFSRPKSYLIFSKNALISPYQNGQALMMRMVSYKNNSLTELSVEVIVRIKEERDGKILPAFYKLPLEIDEINALVLNWTLVHKINEESPIFNYTTLDYEKREVEFLVYVKGFDEHFSNIVKAKHSYHYSELIENAKFDLMFKQSDDKTHTILELDKIDHFHHIES